MTDLKMGINNLILDRQQNSELNFNINQRTLTDFSIKRILGDDLTTSEIKIQKDFLSLKPEDILDLSRYQRNEINFYNHSNSIYYDNYNLSQNKNYFFKSFLSTEKGYLRANSVTLPKVHKLWNSNVTMNFKLNDYWHGSDFYLKSNPENHQEIYHHQYHQRRLHDVILKKDISGCDSDKGYLLNSTLYKINNNNNLSENLSITNKSDDIQFVNYQKKTYGLLIDDQEICFKCQICEKVFGCSATLQSHIKTHKSPRYGCVECGKGFSQLRNYKYHLSVHRGTKEFAAECPECGKMFNDKGYLSSHMKIHRNKKEYECSYCPKSFNQRVAFNMHVRIHTGVKPHKCAECGKRFSRKMLLKQHMRTHSGEKPYQCIVCGKSFADRSNMTLHHRLHSGIKPFTCPICPKAFTKKHHLKTHLNYHTGCKPYICPHLNCNQAFTQSSNMRTHAKKCQFKLIDIGTKENGKLSFIEEN